MMHLPRLALYAGMALTTASQAAAPIQPVQAGEKPKAGSTEAELWYGMDQAEKEIRQSPYIIHDPALNEYVQGVLCKVTGPHCQDLRLYLVEIPVFNASMAPNGVVLVFSGALLRMQDEAELALVLSHEFAHYQQRHSLQSWQKAKKTSAFLTTFGALTWAGGVGLAGTLAQFAGLANLMEFSRDMEREADSLGFDAAVAQGYDPQAGVRLWKRMQDEEKANARAKYNPVFASHPKSAERMADVAAAAAKHPTGTGQTYQTRYDQATDPFVADWLEQELSRRMYDTSIQVIGELHADAQPERLGIYEFYLAEAYRQRGGPGDLAQANRLYALAVTREHAPAAAWREWGLVLASQGQKADAVKYLTTYLEKAPTADDRLFVQNDIRKLEGGQ